MNTTAGFSLIGMLKICVALNKEKGFASFRNPVAMWTIRAIIGLHPIPFKFFVPKCARHIKTPLLKPVYRFVSLSKEIGKVPVSRGFKV